MGNDWQKDTVEFQTKMGQECHTKPTLPSKKTLKLRYKLIDEEVNKELLPALKLYEESGYRSLCEADIADGIVDSIYVLIGCAVSFGVDLGPIWDKVHEANMLKAGGLRDKNGKILKPEGWVHPDIAKLIEEQMKEE
jgi:predicted HAD superfamily Cof-like phosphohydrolase